MSQSAPSNRRRTLAASRSACISPGSAARRAAPRRRGQAHHEKLSSRWGPMAERLSAAMERSLGSDGALPPPCLNCMRLAVAAALSMTLDTRGTLANPRGRRACAQLPRASARARSRWRPAAPPCSAAAPAACSSTTGWAQRRAPASMPACFGGLAAGRSAARSRPRRARRGRRSDGGGAAATRRDGCARRCPSTTTSRTSGSGSSGSGCPRSRGCSPTWPSSARPRSWPSASAGASPAARRPRRSSALPACAVRPAPRAASRSPEPTS